LAQTRAAAYLSAANLPGKCLYPVVRDQPRLRRCLPSTVTWARCLISPAAVLTAGPWVKPSRWRLSRAYAADSWCLTRTRDDPESATTGSLPTKALRSG